MSSSDTSSSEDDFMPLGISTLNLKTKIVEKPIVVREVDNSDLPKELQYYSLLSRAMEILNRDKEEGERIKLGLSILRKNKKTFVNVVHIATQLHRQPEHIAQFVSKVLLTDGAINKEGQLVLRGNILQSAIEKAMKQFIDAYVVCKTCESVEDTYITKENKLFFLRCYKCNGSRCIGNSIEGFVFKKEDNLKI